MNAMNNLAAGLRKMSMSLNQGLRQYRANQHRARLLTSGEYVKTGTRTR